MNWFGLNFVCSFINLLSITAEEIYIYINFKKAYIYSNICFIMYTMHISLRKSISQTKLQSNKEYPWTWYWILAMWTFTWNDIPHWCKESNAIELLYSLMYKTKFELLWPFLFGHWMHAFVNYDRTICNKINPFMKKFLINNAILIKIPPADCF